MKDRAVSISVIVPCLNAERTLAEALDSVRGQSVPPDEVLVIDDGSVDRSVEIARAYAPWVRVLRNRSRGPGSARRFGVEEAHGTYIAFVDADDWLAPTKHELQLAAFDRQGPDIVVHTDALLIHEDRSRPDCIRKGADAAVGRCTQTIFERNPICGASCMLRRDMLLRLGNYDADMFGAEDYGMSLAASTCCDFVHIAEPLYRIRRHDGNVTRRRARMAYFHWLAQDRFRQQFPEAFSALPAEVIERCMIQPVLRAVEEAYWQREMDGYAALLRLAHRLRPDDRAVDRLWRRRMVPMTCLRAWDRLHRKDRGCRTCAAEL